MLPSVYNSGTLLQNINGSSSFCKGPRTSKVQGPKVQALKQTKNLSKHNCQKIWMVKTTTVQKIWMGKTTTIQEF